MSGPSSLKRRDLLTLADLTPAQVTEILETAKRQKAAWTAGDREIVCTGRAVAIVLQKPSMRTRISFEVACGRLGIQPVIMAGDDSAFSRGETVGDTGRVMERYVDAIVIRTFEHSLVEELADVVEIPVINALTDDHHPCQGLADLLTIEEKFGRIDGLRFTYVGDGNNMANTYLLAGALTGMHVTIASPAGFEPPAAVVDQARTLASQTGARIEVVSDPRAAVAGADIVCTDTWASMGQEAEHDSRLAAFAPYRVDSELMSLAAEGAIFMHCLPAHRGEEVTDEVIDSSASVVFDEAANRLHAQQALLSLVLG